MNARLQRLYEEAAQAGFPTIYIRHERFCSKLYGSESSRLETGGYLRSQGHRPDEKGGVTVVAMRALTGEVTFAFAACSRKDNYNRARGIEIALGRALSALRKGTALWITVSDPRETVSEANVHRMYVRAADAASEEDERVASMDAFWRSVFGRETYESMQLRRGTARHLPEF